MQKFGIGQPVRRVEDVRFVTGGGGYTDDLTLPGQAYGYVLRSPWAHAAISSINVADARAADGVLGVWTAADLSAAGIGELPCAISGVLRNRDGSTLDVGGRVILARDRAMHAGDGLAFIVAETLAQAMDAAELIAVDAEELPAAANLAEAVKETAPRLRDAAPGNVCFDWEGGDAAAVDAAFAGAAHITAMDLVHNRLAPSPIEPRAALGHWESGRHVLRTSTQGANLFQRVLAPVLGVAEDALRIITADVGGSFGMKEFIYPEHVLVLFAARKLGRPVKWTGERSDAFQSDLHGRDMISHAEIAFDTGGRAIAMRVHNRANMGAYVSLFGPGIQTLGGARLTGGVYAIPSISVRVTGYYSNSVPVDAYRGAGRPEAAYVIERLMDKAARELGLTPDEIRRRNFIGPDQLPYSHPLGFVFDSGAFEANMDEGMRLAGWASFPGRREAALARGRLRGIGMACYIESSVGFGYEAAEIRFPEDGTVEIIAGTMSAGQGHETVWAQIVTEQLGVPFEAIRLIQGDTDRVKVGGGTAGSRSTYMVAGAFRLSSDQVIGKGKALVAALLGEAPEAIEFGEGLFRSGSSNRSMSIMEVASAARRADGLDADLRRVLADGLDSGATFNHDVSTFPNGCHVCEVEVDPDTGKVETARYLVVDDFGRILNPMVVDGQVHGGIAQGLGQALMEHCLHDPDTGQLITGSFMDYAMPRADDFCDIETVYNEVPCTTSPYGVKGCGEAGTTGACPAIMNAVLDALSVRGVTGLDMPATPLRVWDALRRAG
ncbi:xanthine dehydrogenase family protein molybdopterin-binding subunit [Emcibacter sp. SYSU 3D8]|uniref:xanthine dehydrogenase family protein molybdopterin-binding subunit n=1 Tax=Emcibacter sp. SYSU 3D8 TaxID=3133969 RepID=UPI0031FED298